MFVLIVIKDMDWEKDVLTFVEKLDDFNSNELEVMMQDWYRLI